MKTKKVLMVAALVMVMTMVPMLSIAAEAARPDVPGRPDMDRGTVEVDTRIVLGIPFHGVTATYTRRASVGELPMNYIFRWETTLDGEHLYYRELVSEPVTADQVEYTVITIHLWGEPDYIPAGEYETEMIVFALFADGTETISARGSDSFYFEGYTGPGLDY